MRRVEILAFFIVRCYEIEGCELWCMSSKTENRRVNIYINSDNAGKSLRALSQEARKLTNEIANVEAGSNEYEILRRKLIEVQNEVVHLRQDTRGLNNEMRNPAPLNSFNNLNKKAEELRSQLMGLKVGSKEFNATLKEYKNVNQDIDNFNRKLNGTSGIMGRLKSEIKQFGSVAAMALAGAAVTAFVNNTIKGAAKLSDELSDIEKVSGLSAKAVKELNDELGKLDTRTSRSDLRGIAVGAGRSGLGNAANFGGDEEAAKAELMGAVQAIDQVNIALGDTFNSAEEVSERMLKLREIFLDIKSANVGDDITYIANAMNELENTGNTTAPRMADFANRIGGVGITLGLTTGQVLGMSATLDQLGVTAERGGTAVVRILQKMTQNTADFAKIANMDVTEFTNIVNTDLFGAFQLVLQGANDSGTSATALSQIIEGLGIDGAGASEVFAKLGGNMALLQTKVDMATGSLKSQDSILGEVEKKNNNLAAKIDKLNKVISSAFTNSTLMEWLEGIIDFAPEVIGFFSSLPKTINEYSGAIRNLTALMLVYNSASVASVVVGIKAKAVTIANTIATAANNLVTKIRIGFMNLAITAQLLYNAAMVKGSFATRAMSVAQVALNAVMGANPIGATILAIAGLVAIMKNWESITGRKAKQEEHFAETHSKVVASVKAGAIALEKYKNATKELETATQSRLKAMEEEIQLELRKVKAAELSAYAHAVEQADMNEELSLYQLTIVSLQSLLSAKKAIKLEEEMMQKNRDEAMGQYEEEIKALGEQKKALQDMLNGIDNEKNAYSNAMKIKASTTAQYQEKIRLLQTALKHAEIGSSQYNKIIKELANTKSELAKKTEENTEATKDEQKAIEEFVKNTAELRKKLRDEQIKGMKDLEAQELATEEERYKREVEEVKNTVANAKVKNDLLLQMKRNHESAVSSIEKAFQDERMKEAWNASMTEKEIAVMIAKEGSAERLQAEKDLLLHKLEQAKIVGAKTQAEILMMEESTRLAIEKLDADHLLKQDERQQRSSLAYMEMRILHTQEGSAARLQAELDYLEQQMLYELENAELTEEERALIFEKFLLKRQEMEGAFLANNTRKIKEAQNEILNSFMSMYNSIRAIENSRSEARIAQIQKEKEEELKSIETSKNGRILSESERAKKVHEIEEKYRRIERQEKIKQFNRQKQAAMIEATINTAVAVTKAIAQFPAIPAVAAAVAIAGGLQVAAIGSQPMPEFAEGGSTARAIAQGGKVNQKTLAWVGEKGPEWVAPNWMIRSPKFASTFSMLENERLRGFAKGGSTSTTAPVGTDGLMFEKMEMLMMDNKKVMEQLMSRIQEPATAIVNYQSFVDADESIAYVKDRNTF